MPQPPKGHGEGSALANAKGSLERAPFSRTTCSSSADLHTCNLQPSTRSSQMSTFELGQRFKNVYF